MYSGSGLHPAAGVGFLLLGETLGGPLGYEFGPDPLDGSGRCPDTTGENLPALLLGDGPCFPGGFDPAGQGGVTWSQQYPTLRHG